MSVSYQKLWHILIDRRISKTELRKAINVSSSTFAKLSNDEYIALTVVEKICHELKCTPNDILEFTKAED